MERELLYTPVSQWVKLDQPVENVTQSHHPNLTVNVDLEGCKTNLLVAAADSFWPRIDVVCHLDGVSWGL